MLWLQAVRRQAKKERKRGEGRQGGERGEGRERVALAASSSSGPPPLLDLGLGHTQKPRHRGGYTVELYPHCLTVSCLSSLPSPQSAPP